MIRTTYRKEGEALTRFVKKHPCQDWYVWCEQSAENPAYDVAQGTCDGEDLPPEIKAACDSYTGVHYPCVWPF